MGKFLKRKKFFMTMEDETMQKHGRKRGTLPWTGSDGRNHKLEDMDVNYVRNCVNKIKRDGLSSDRIAMLPHLENELIYRQILKSQEE